MAWRRLWKASVFQATISPLLFLAAMGLGLGDLVNKGSGGVDGVDYLVFVAPGLMAASAMMQAAGESLWPVIGGVKWMRTYHAAVVDAGAARVRCSPGTCCGCACGSLDVGDGVPRRRRDPRRRAVVVGCARDPRRGARRVGVRGRAERLRRHPGERPARSR